MPAPADLALRAGDLPAVEVDVEVVPVEALVSAVPAGGVARQWTADGRLVFALGPLQVDRGGVAASTRCSAGSSPRRAARVWMAGRV